MNAKFLTQVPGPVCVQQMLAAFINFLFHWIKIAQVCKTGGRRGRQRKKVLHISKILNCYICAEYTNRVLEKFLIFALSVFSLAFNFSNYYYFFTIHNLKISACCHIWPSIYYHRGQNGPFYIVPIAQWWT